MMMHIASHGYVVITPEKLQDSLIALNATWIDEVDDWAQKHLSDRLTSAGNSTIWLYTL